jgi:hypothetical protein
MGALPAIERAVGFLVRRQLPHGEFATFQHFDPRLLDAGAFDSSPFVTTFVLHALDFVSGPAVDGLRDKAKAFLRQEMEAPGVWRYWSSRNDKRIDPDVDDTSCASFALRGDEGLNGNVPALLANRHESGLFLTWLRPPTRNNDLDAVVNANVLLYLGERPETLAARDLVIEEILQGRDTRASSYYVHPLSLHHAVARAYEHGVKGFAVCRDAAVARCRQALADDAGPMTLAMALCTLLAHGVAPGPDEHRAVDALLAMQSSEGGWEREAFYAGPEPPTPHAVYWGSEELTTALCLEALARMEGRGP